MSSKITQEEISEIMSLLSEVQPKCFDLGIHLKITHNQLQVFEKSPHFMVDMISYWINNSDEPTWEALAAALESIGRKDIASRIHHNYIALKTVDANKEIKAALEEIEERKRAVGSCHLTAHQHVRRFYSDLHESLESHCNGLKQELQKSSRGDKQKIEKLQKDLKSKIDESRQQKAKLENLQTKPFDVHTLAQINDVKKSIENIRHQLQEIQEDIDSFSLAKVSGSIANADVNDADLLVDDLTSHLKLEEDTDSLKISISDSWDNIAECYSVK